MPFWLPFFELCCLCTSSASLGSWFSHALCFRHSLCFIVEVANKQAGGYGSPAFARHHLQALRLLPLCSLCRWQGCNWLLKYPPFLNRSSLAHTYWKGACERRAFHETERSYTLRREIDHFQQFASPEDFFSPISTPITHYSPQNKHIMPILPFPFFAFPSCLPDQRKWKNPSTTIQRKKKRQETDQNM